MFLSYLHSLHLSCISTLGMSKKIGELYLTQLVFDAILWAIVGCGSLQAVAIAGQCKMQLLCTSVWGEGGLCITVLASILHAKFT